MRGELVAIDLETTGLDASQDEIIEIGAVRVVDGQIVEEYSALVHPGRSIPPLVTILTGISNDDLIGAPVFAVVAGALQKFVGAAPLLGHNISFDAGFLNKRGLFVQNARVDTYDLASVLLPSAPRYALSHLTELFGFDIGSAHRALYDARATAFVFNKLWERALALPFNTLQEIVALAEGIPWDGRAFFTAALQERLARGDQASASHHFPALAVPAPPLASPSSSGPATAIDRAAVAAAFADSGPLAQQVPGYERRQQQVDMADAVAEALNTPHHLLIEAGTGTGKTIAYLLPLAAWAMQNQRRVVVSTNTLNLQDQLLQHDLPVVRAALGVDFRAAILKGRSNYLCPIEFDRVRRLKPNSVDALRAVAKTRVWLDETVSGDRTDLSLRGPEENLVWQHMSAEHAHCGLDRCASIGSVCPFYRARREAENAHLVIVNHALLLADAAANGGVIPEYDTLIADEAHHLEEATTNSLARTVDEAAMKRQLWELGDTRTGLLSQVLAQLQASASPKMVERFTAFIGDLAGVLRAMRAQIGRLFDSLRALLAELSLNQETYGSIRIMPSIRARNEFSAVQLTWHDLSESIQAAADALEQIAAAGARVESLREGRDAGIFAATAIARQGLLDLSALVNEILSMPKANTVYWLQVGQTHDYIAMHLAPLHIGDLVKASLWNAKRTVVLTSATLRAGTDFKYVRERLGAEDMEAVEIGSPFDYTKSALLFLPEDMPEPNDKQRYQQAVERAIIELASALDGRVLALFTSYTSLRQTAYAITPRLALGNIAVYDQSDGSSRQALIDGFKSTQRAVLMGTRSFWEGVDFTGGQLSAVVIARLPFSVPTDPVFSARSDGYHDAFNEYTMPDAIMRFRQGFGRLIRRSTDRGVVVVLDARLVHKSYGQHFIDALPDPSVHRGLLSTLPAVARNWVNRPAT